MLSYLNDPAVKQKHIARFDAHREADEVVQGLGFGGGRGCFVGCTLDGYEHYRFPAELGWPLWLAHLADILFERIPEEDAAQFGTDLLNAVPVGVDLEPIRWQLAIWRHTSQLQRLDTGVRVVAADERSAFNFSLRQTAGCKVDADRDRSDDFAG